MAEFDPKKMPPIEQLRGRTIGRVLIKMGILTREDVHKCLTIQKQRGGKAKLGEILLELGLVDEKELHIARAAQRGMEYINLNEINPLKFMVLSISIQSCNGYLYSFCLCPDLCRRWPSTTP